MIRFTPFLNTLLWPSGAADFGHFGVSFSELLILFEQWAGHWLLSEKVTRPHVRANRPILIPSVPVSEGIEIRHGCQFLSSLVRALAKLPGGIGPGERFELYLTAESRKHLSPRAVPGHPVWVCRGATCGAGAARRGGSR